VLAIYCSSSATEKTVVSICSRFLTSWRTRPITLPSLEDEAELKRVEHELDKAHNILDKKRAELFKWGMKLDYPPEPEDPEALCNYERVKDELDLLIEGCRRLLQRMSDLTLGTKGKRHHPCQTEARKGRHDFWHSATFRSGIVIFFQCMTFVPPGCAFPLAQSCGDTSWGILAPF
jgi:hypothetical protein